MITLGKTYLKVFCASCKGEILIEGLEIDRSKCCYTVYGYCMQCNTPQELPCDLTDFIDIEITLLGGSEDEKA